MKEKKTFRFRGNWYSWYIYYILRKNITLGLLLGLFNFPTHLHETGYRRPLKFHVYMELNLKHVIKAYQILIFKPEELFNFLKK